MWAGSQSIGSSLRRDIALGFGQKFETVCFQKRGIKVDMQMGYVGFFIDSMP